MKNELETTDYNIIEQDSNIAKSNSTTLTIGMLLDGMYEIRREIARGGMGIVYEAYHKVFNKKVAIKIILPITIDSLQLKRFQKEVRAYSNLSHPNIIHIYNVGIYENTPYIVMDYIDGVNICQYVAQHDENYRKQKLHNAELGIKRDWKLCVKLIYETALALEYIHKQKMIHRDIKPSNIIVRSDGTPIIIDLGLVKFQSEKFTNLTQSGELLGTLSYMPIEQAQGKHGKIDARSDIYSLGLVLYELLTGEMAYSGENILEISYKIMSYYPPLPRKINPQIPEALEKITMHAIDKKKEKRYATAQEFANELKKYLDNENVQGTRKNNDYKKQVLLQRNRRISVKCSIVLVLLWGFLFIALFPVSKTVYIETPRRYIKTPSYIETLRFKPRIISSPNIGESKNPGSEVKKEESEVKARNIPKSEAEKLSQPGRNNENRVTKNSQKLFEDYEKSANNGDMNAQYKLANMYYNGWRTQQDYKKAIYWYEKLANNGNENAQYKLAVIYYNGLGVEKDYKKAIEWYEKASKQGHVNAQYKLADMYYNGLGVEKDYNKAREWYEKLANNGDINVQYRLADMYYNGLGVEQDCNKAIEWYEKLANNGDENAQSKLADIYYLGLGVEQDCNKAIYWYEEASKQGHVNAQYKLADMYYNGLGVEKDYNKARELYGKLAYNDNISTQINLDSKTKLGNIYYYGLGIRKDWIVARHLYDQAAQQGYIDAQYYLGLLHYEKGLGVTYYEIGRKSELEEACKWLEKAANKGHKEATKLLNKIKQLQK